MTLMTKPVRPDSEQKRAALADAAREETTRLNVFIPKLVHQRLRLKAATEPKGTTIGQIVTRAVDEYFDRVDEQK